MSKILVSFFSASGITKNISQKLQETLNADIFEIKPEILYTSEDLDWTNKDSRSTKEMNNRTFRPPIKSSPNTSGYEKIYIGFPVWWYTAPTIINTFIESIETENKTLIPFCTSGGTGIEGCQKDLENAYPDIKGKRLRTENDIKKWIS